VHKPLIADAESASQPAPAACPFCRSPKVTTPSQKADSSTYWRCEACGQMWNVARLRASSRYGYEGRWNECRVDRRRTGRCRGRRCTRRVLAPGRTACGFGGCQPSMDLGAPLGLERGFATL